MNSSLILALETSGRHGSVAVLRGDVVLASGQISPQQRTAAALTPLIRDTMNSASIALTDLDCVAVTSGPGSFTGLRVGVTTAKTLAYVLNCQVIGVNTLSVIAHQSPSNVASVNAVMDAQRQQLFAATFRRDAQGRMTEVEPTTIIDNDAWLASLSDDAVVCGPGLTKLRSTLPSAVMIIDDKLWEPTAKAVGAVANAMIEAGQYDDLWKLTPQYFRKSAAEEKLAR